jgi:hypothetical protein
MSRIEPPQQLTQNLTWNGFFVPAPYEYNMPWWAWWNGLYAVGIVHAYLMDTQTRVECHITEYGTRILTTVPVDRKTILRVLEENLTKAQTRTWFKKFILWRERNAHPE